MKHATRTIELNFSVGLWILFEIIKSLDGNGIYAESVEVLGEGLYRFPYKDQCEEGITSHRIDMKVPKK